MKHFFSNWKYWVIDSPAFWALIVFNWLHEHGHLYILAETQTQVETIIIDLKHIIMLPFFPQNWSKIAATIFAIANYSENLSCFHYFNVIYHSIVLCSFKNYTSEWKKLYYWTYFRFKNWNEQSCCKFWCV